MRNLFTQFTMLSAAAGLLLAGCAKDAGAVQGGDGTIDVRLSTSSEVVSVEATRVAGSLEGIVETPANSEFSLRIVRDGANPETSPFWDDITQYPVDTKHQVGDYTATALYGDANVEGFDKPAFGVKDQPFTVEHNVVKTVPLTARLLNTAVTVDCTNEFKGYFSDYSITVLRGAVEVAEFSETETRALFLKPEAFSIRVDYTHQSNGKTGSYTLAVAEVDACTHYVLKLNVNEGKVGGAEIEIIWNDDTQTVELDPVDIGEPEE